MRGIRRCGVAPPQDEDEVLVVGWLSACVLALPVFPATTEARIVGP